MDAFRLANLSSRDRFVSGLSVPREGKRQVQKHKKSSSFSSDSSACHFDTSAEDTPAFEPRWKSVHQPVEMPMRSLLAQEMSKQSESKRRSPSIIARLMGLDGFPPQSSSHRQHKNVDNHQQRMRGSEKAHRGSTSNGPGSSRSSSKDEQEFKDVFEVLETPKVENSRYLYQGRENANLTEAEMAFIRQKFLEAKRLSTDEKLHHSKEFHDAIEALDSNKDLLLKFLQHPDSLFTKHLHDLQDIVPERRCRQVPLKSPSGPKHVNIVSGQKPDKEFLRRRHKSPRKYGPGCSPSHSHTRHVAYNNTPRLPEENLEEKTGLQPTRIVVLKPNLEKTWNADRILLSPSSSSDDFRADCRLPCSSSWESEVQGKHRTCEDVSFTSHKSRESREIAKTITRQMRTSCGKDGFMNFRASGFRGYAGDESSSGSDSASELELVPVTSRTRATLNRKNQPRSLSSGSLESSVNREAKKRLSERWKLAHKSEEEREICRRSTLAEMLAISDREARPASFNGIIFEEGLSRRFENSVEQSESSEPLGISSRDGWKGTCTRISSKPRTLSHQESPRSYRIVIPKGLTKRDGSVKGSSSNNGEASSSSKSRPRRNRSQSSCSTSPEINSSPVSSKVLYMDEGLFEQKLPASKAHTSLSVEVHSDIENGSNSENVKITMPSELSHPDISAATSVTDTVSDQDTLRSQVILAGSSNEIAHSSTPELQSQASTKEADQPSPISVLEPAFPDDFSSSSECFESLNADLQGLRMQLQLLKLETGGYEEGSMLVSSDEDADQEVSSFRQKDEKMDAEACPEDWKCLYLLDVLANSRFSDSDPDTFMATWHSSESPVTPSLFEELEKKYSNLIFSTRSERKFLFDQINCELLQIFQQFTDPHPWVKPTRVCPKWDINRLQETLRKLVMRKDEKPRKDSREKVLQKESQWLSLEDDIEVIGREIEKLLTDELIAELVAAI